VRLPDPILAGAAHVPRAMFWRRGLGAAAGGSERASTWAPRTHGHANSSGGSRRRRRRCAEPDGDGARDGRRGRRSLGADGTAKDLFGRGTRLLYDLGSRKGQDIAASRARSSSRGSRSDARGLPPAWSSRSRRTPPTLTRSRAYRSQISAHASRQSRVIATAPRSRLRTLSSATLFGVEGGAGDRRIGAVSRAPSAVEFWQGRADRLHDRLRSVSTGTEIGSSSDCRLSALGEREPHEPCRPIQGISNVSPSARSPRVRRKPASGYAALHQSNVPPAPRACETRARAAAPAPRPRAGGRSPSRARAVARARTRGKGLAHDRRDSDRGPCSSTAAWSVSGASSPAKTSSSGDWPGRRISAAACARPRRRLERLGRLRASLAHHTVLRLLERAACAFVSETLARRAGLEAANRPRPGAVRRPPRPPALASCSAEWPVRASPEERTDV